MADGNGGGSGAGLSRAVRWLIGLDERTWRLTLGGLTHRERIELAERWSGFEHGGQRVPEGDWRVWLMLAGRGFGKTRAGAEWVSAMARTDGRLRIALVGATEDDVRKVMIEGQSGLIAVAGRGEDVIWVPTLGKLTFHSGAEATVYSGETPEKLRGPEHHIAWCDEIAKWRHADATWDNLMLTLRLGDRPRTLVTTTPRPIGLLKRLLRDPEVAVTRGRTADNAHLPPAFVEAMTRSYGGTRLGRQELDGAMIDDVEGALWTRGLIEGCRSLDDASRLRSTLARDERTSLVRVVIGVDPPVSVGGDACGIVVCGVRSDGVALVLEDASVAGASPDGWARAVAAAAARWGADRVIAEANQGGAMVESVLRAAEADLPITLVHASRGKVARAEPVAALFEKRRALFAGAFPKLEDELAGLSVGGGYEGPGRSPDRADAMVWALTELMLKTAAGAPGVRVM